MLVDVKIVIEKKGGPGSGHRGHAGRPGKVGGSVAGKGKKANAIVDISNDTIADEFANKKREHVVFYNESGDVVNRVVGTSIHTKFSSKDIPSGAIVMAHNHPLTFGVPATLSKSDVKSLVFAANHGVDKFLVYDSQFVYRIGNLSKLIGMNSKSLVSEFQQLRRQANESYQYKKTNYALKKLAKKYGFLYTANQISKR